MLFHEQIYHVTSSLVQTIPPLTHMNIRTMHCKIALSHVQSFDHLITCAILSYIYLTILTFTAQHSQIYSRDTAKLNAFASHNDRFRSSEFCTSIFFHIISAAVYDPNLTFSIARILCRFCLSANCERALHYMFSISNKFLFTHQALASMFSDHDIVTVIIIISVINGNDW